MKEQAAIINKLRRRGFNYLRLEQLGNGYWWADCGNLDSPLQQLVVYASRTGSRTILMALRKLEAATKGKIIK